MIYIVLAERSYQNPFKIDLKIRFPWYSYEQSKILEILYIMIVSSGIRNFVKWIVCVEYAIETLETGEKYVENYQ